MHNPLICSVILYALECGGTQGPGWPLSFFCEYLIGIVLICGRRDFCFFSFDL